MSRSTPAVALTAMRGIATRIVQLVVAVFFCAVLGGACSSNVVALEGCPNGQKRCTLDTGEAKCVSVDDPAFGCADQASCASCFVPHAASTLCDSTGQCSFGSCQAGFQHCPGSTSNGCDAESATDVHNCGMCGNDCEKLRMASAEVVHVLSTKCAKSNCAVLACEPGFLDCDNDLLTNGCETDASVGCMR